MPALAAASDAPVTFRIHDHRDPAEIEETTGVYVDGREVAVFRLGPDREDDMVSVTVNGAGDHTYALCGRVTVRRTDGSVATREVNGAGHFSDLADRDFDAIAAEDFTIFYLRDITIGRPPAPMSAEPRRGCTPNVAAR